VRLLIFSDTCMTKWHSPFHSSIAEHTQELTLSSSPHVVWILFALLSTQQWKWQQKESPWYTEFVAHKSLQLLCYPCTQMLLHYVVPILARVGVPYWWRVYTVQEMKRNCTIVFRAALNLAHTLRMLLCGAQVCMITNHKHILSFLSFFDVTFSRAICRTKRHS